MLMIPSHGFARSVREHNVQLDALADWIEGSVVFAATEVSQADVVDALREASLYDSQELATERVQDAWQELRRRTNCACGACSYAIDHARVRRIAPWRKSPVYSFCLMLSLQVYYRDTFKPDYAEQGRLFEQLTAECLSALGYQTHLTGWSRTHTSALRTTIRDLATALGEPERSGGAMRWTRPKAKDAGLDVMCVRPFPDGWGGRPLYLVQCATGSNWDAKLHTPDLRTWSNLIEFTTAPVRGLAMPFAPLADDFRRAAGRDGLGLLLDRCRLLSPAAQCGTNWPSTKLVTQLNRWTTPRVGWLPRDNV